MSKERIHNKIRKLLRLAESDNPHEAERAKTQAKALMQKHQIGTDELEIVEVNGQSIPRKNLKEYELELIWALEAISGCKTFLSAIPHYQKQRAKWEVHPVFLGPQAEAEIAAYTWDVLIQQMDQYRKQIKREFLGVLKTRDTDALLTGWTYSAAQKIHELFPKKATHAGAKASLEKQNLPTCNTRSVRLSDKDRPLISAGQLAGESARLHIAASHQSNPQKALL